MTPWYRGKAVGKALGDEDPKLAGPTHERFVEEVQPAVPQADGDPGPRTSREPYPRLLSIEQDEMIYHLKRRVEILERDIQESRVPK